MTLAGSQQPNGSEVLQQLHARQQQQKQGVQHVGVLAHTHSHTVVYSHLQQHTHKVVLMRPWAPGQNGNPEATLNSQAFCDELNARLLNMDATLLHMLTAQRQPQAAGAAAAGSMEACRQQLEGSLEKQVAFSTALMLDWCGATPVGSSEQVLQQLLSSP